LSDIGVFALVERGSPAPAADEKCRHLDYEQQANKCKPIAHEANKIIGEMRRPAPLTA
jgi:hypothetical protein